MRLLIGFNSKQIFMYFIEEVSMCSSLGCCPKSGCGRCVIHIYWYVIHILYYLIKIPKVLNTETHLSPRVLDKGLWTWGNVGLDHIMFSLRFWKYFAWDNHFWIRDPGYFCLVPLPFSIQDIQGHYVWLLHQAGKSMSQRMAHMGISQASPGSTAYSSAQVPLANVQSFGHCNSWGDWEM